MACSIDTHAAAERLADAGADPALARAIVAEVARADDAYTAHLATKADLAEAKLHIILAVIAVAGLLFAALRLTG